MIEKILKEINRLKGDLDGYSALEALDYLESYINVTSRESASEDLEKEVHEHLLNIGATIEMYSGNVMGLDLCEDDYVDFARHFAEWQRKKDQETIELAEDHAMLAGMEKMREEMMKDAVEAEVMCPASSSTLQIRYKLPKNTKLKYGDKVQIIIVNEEQQ